MNILKKIVLIVLIISAVYCVTSTQKISKPIDTKIEENSQRIEENKEIEPAPQENQIVQETVSIYFIGQNSNKEDVYKIVKRKYDPEKDGTKLDFALNELLKGPNYKEITQGIYTEIPKDTKLRSISKINDKKYIDLSFAFEQGGGTDSLYKRLYQLIKTINKNTKEDIYLKIEGKEVDVIGGEGIMINQPLTIHSLDS